MHTRFRKDLIAARNGLVSLTARLETMQGYIDTLESNDSSQDSSISALQIALDALEAEVAAHIAQVDKIQLNTELAEEDIPTAKGAFYWDSENETAAINLTDEVTYNFGEEVFAPLCRNSTGEDIPNGSIVYVSGALGGRPRIALADADDYTSATKLLGITTELIPNNSDGRVTIHGTVRDLNTKAYAEGTCLYLSTNEGAWADATPTYGKKRIKIGIVTRSHITQGSIAVDITDNIYMFGNVLLGNYSYFKDDGTYVAVNNAKCTLDEFGSLIASRIESPSSKIQQNLSEGTIDFADDCTLSDYLLLNMQINHNWDMVTPMDTHVHWKQNSDDVPNLLRAHRWQVNGQPWVSDWTYTKHSESKFSVDATPLLQITDFPEITVPDPIGVSSILQVRFYRDTNNDSGLFSGVDTYSGDLQAVFLDGHKTVDMLGSSEEYTK